MPTINESTPRETYTISGENFKLPQPYTEGHVLTAGEASQLNQVYAENLRNNLAKKVSDQKDTGFFDAELFQSHIDDYASTYEMGVRTGGGGRVGDPVLAEAISIAKELIRKAIRAKGYKLADVPAKVITNKAKELIESGRHPEILETAKARVEEAKLLGDIELGSLESPSEPEAEAEAPATKKSPKAPAHAEA